MSAALSCASPPVVQGPAGPSAAESRRLHRTFDLEVLNDDQPKDPVPLRFGLIHTAELLPSAVIHRQGQ